MNLHLIRKEFRLYGIFGELRDDQNNLVAVTLEHSYEDKPKLPSGNYSCVRGMHQLSNKPPFETFEITGVPGHTGILFHKGNSNNDSEGCVLLGSSLGTGCILDSKIAFDNFLELQSGKQTFSLVVE